MQTQTPENGPEKKSIDEWRKLGVCRLRLAEWAHPEDYVRFDLFEDGSIGPWFHLYSPTQPLIGEPTPQTMLFTEFDHKAPMWEQYTGPKHEKDNWPR